MSGWNQWLCDPAERERFRTVVKAGDECAEPVRRASVPPPLDKIFDLALNDKIR